MPGSITYLMPGTVSEVSATLVASTIRRPVCGCEHALLLGRGQPGEQRQDLGVGAGCCLRSASAVSRISRSPERNTRMSPGPFGAQLVDRVADGADLVADLVVDLVLVLVRASVDQRAVADLDRIGAARTPRRSAAVLLEVRRRSAAGRSWPR